MTKNKNGFQSEKEQYENLNFKKLYKKLYHLISTIIILNKISQSSVYREGKKSLIFNFDQISRVVFLFRMMKF